MEYIDPLPVKCPMCGAMGSYRVADLITLTARCIFCSHGLEAVGGGMQAAHAENSAFFVMVESALAVEEELGIEVSDSVLEACPTPRDLVLRLAECSGKASVRDIESVVQHTLARLSERDVRTDELAMPWKTFVSGDQ